MSELISGKEALIAIGEGREVEYRFEDPHGWMPQNCLSIDGYINDKAFFRIKPQTIMLNGIKVPAPFKPKEGDVFWHIFPTIDQGYGWCYEDGEDELIKQFGAWRTEEEIRQVVEALRSIFNAN